MFDYLFKENKTKNKRKTFAIILSKQNNIRLSVCLFGRVSQFPLFSSETLDTEKMLPSPIIIELDHL